MTLYTNLSVDAFYFNRRSMMKVALSGTFLLASQSEDCDLIWDTL